MAYHSLPYLTHARHDALAVLVWSPCGLPILTKVPIWVQARPRLAFTNHYHRDGGLGMTEYYIGLELVVGGAVDEGDVMLFFIG
jgi:hypothetical protein